MEVRHIKRFVWLFALLIFLCCPVAVVDGYFAQDSFTEHWQKPVTDSKQSKAKNEIKYVVQPGDSVWSITQAFQLEMDQVRSGNNLAGDCVIHPGQVLILPCNNMQSHRVDAGETLWSLSRQYHVSVIRLMACNEIANPEALPVGKILIIPGSGATEKVIAARGKTNLRQPHYGHITSYFGPRGGGFHHGVDFAADVGDPIKAADSGYVVFTGEDPIYGKKLIIDHGGSLKTLYAHLSAFRVKDGDFIARGEVLGEAGNTGRSTGPHLHFEVRINDRAVDPLPYLKK